jgi:tellurite resistance protein
MTRGVVLASVAASAQTRARRRPAIPPSAFSIAFGLAGLADLWRAAQPVARNPPAVANAMFVLTAVVWCGIVVLYGAQGWRHLIADLCDPVLAPFVPLAAIVPMMLGAALATVAFAAGRVIVIVGMAVTFLLGGWLFAEWIIDKMDNECLHPGYFLPTVAGGGVGAYAAAQVHLHQAAEASFGLGVITWLLLSSTVLNRLFFLRPLPSQLEPLVAIEVGAPAVLGVGYFALTGGTRDLIAYALGAYTALMLVAQSRLISLYRRLPFSIGFWAFTFSYAITAGLMLKWITLSKVPGATGYAVVLLVLITVLVAAVTARTIVAIARGQFFTGPPAPVPAQRRIQPPAHVRQQHG